MQVYFEQGEPIPPRNISDVGQQTSASFQPSTQGIQLAYTSLDKK